MDEPTNIKFIKLNLLLHFWGSVFRGSVPFEVRSFEVQSNSRFGPFRGSVIRGSVTFELWSFEVWSYSRFSHSRFGHLRFTLSTFSLSRFGLSKFGHSRFGHGFQCRHYSLSVVQPAVPYPRCLAICLTLSVVQPALPFSLQNSQLYHLICRTANCILLHTVQQDVLYHPIYIHYSLLYPPLTIKPFV
jgi:hypothetical protein